MSFDFLGADSAPSLEEVASGKVVLKHGSKGAAVRYVQEHLAFTGKDIDGDYGNKTEARVKEFQVAKGISPVNGEVDKNTMAAIDAMIMAGQKFSPVPTASPSAAVSSPSAASAPASKPADNVSAAASSSPPAPRSSSTVVPLAQEIKAKTETSPITTYATYGAVGAGTLAILYALFGKKIKGLK